MGVNPIRDWAAGAPQQQLGGAGFQPYAAGARHYGGGRAAPNVGQVDNAQAAAGYNQRDVLANARRNALIQRAQGGI